MGLICGKGPVLGRVPEHYVPLNELHNLLTADCRGERHSSLSSRGSPDSAPSTSGLPAATAAITGARKPPFDHHRCGGNDEIYAAFRRALLHVAKSIAGEGGRLKKVFGI